MNTPHRSGTAFRSASEAKALPPTTRWHALAALVCCCFCSAARADLEFVGVLVTSQATRFALGDTTTGKTDWVARGEKFAGYTVVGYDAQVDQLTLARDGVEFRLRLKDDAKIQSSRLELTGAITFGGDEKVEVQRATLHYDRENVFPLKDGLTYRITPTRDESGNIRYTIMVERILAENKKEKISAPTVVALPGHSFKIQVGELGFAFTPR